ncbi:MAG: hypothetical protein KJ914_18585 [Gammaproteobacteria bacterium]|nr:hypothetical protein [Gammaproteobacteria bacterium]
MAVCRNPKREALRQLQEMLGLSHAFWLELLRLMDSHGMNPADVLKLRMPEGQHLILQIARMISAADNHRPASGFLMSTSAMRMNGFLSVEDPIQPWPIGFECDSRLQKIGLGELITEKNYSPLLEPFRPPVPYRLALAYFDRTVTTMQVEQAFIEHGVTSATMDDAVYYQLRNPYAVNNRPVALLTDRCYWTDGSPLVPYWQNLTHNVMFNMTHVMWPWHNMWRFLVRVTRES